MQLSAEHGKLAAYYNLDNGTGKIRGIYLDGNEKARAIFTDWFGPFKGMGASTVNVASSGGSDHLSFEAVGLPAFPFIQDPLDYDTRTHHSNVDVYERLVMDDLKFNAMIVAVMALNTAMRQELMPRKALPAAESFSLETGLMP